MARIRYTSHVRRMLRGLGLTEIDVQHVIGSYERMNSNAETGLQSAVAAVGRRRVRVVYRADEQGLVVVSVQAEVANEADD